MEKETTREVSEADREALKHHRIANALATLQNIEERKRPQKLRSKKKRRAREKQAHRSRVRNG